MPRKRDLPSGVWIKTGAVRVNSLYEVAKHEGVIVYEADLRAKYAEIFGYSSSSDAPGQIQIELCATENTLHAEKSKRPTQITFQLPGPDPKYYDFWMPVTSLSKYTLSIIFYRHRKT